MVTKISIGKSLYGALAYNGEKINEAKGRLLATNRIYNDGTGMVNIGKAQKSTSAPQWSTASPIGKPLKMFI